MDYNAFVKQCLPMPQIRPKIGSEKHCNLMENPPFAKMGIREPKLRFVKKRYDFV
jgi:hypothetical protein